MNKQPSCVLMLLVGDLVHKFGREAARRVVEEHYQRNQQNVRSPLEEHKREFATAWDGMRAKVVNSLSPAERQVFDALGSEHQREGFLMVRASRTLLRTMASRTSPSHERVWRTGLAFQEPGPLGIIVEAVRSRGYHSNPALC